MTVTPPVNEVEAEIMSTLRRFSRGVTGFNADLVLSALDSDDAGLVYQPEERPEALHSRADVAKYVSGLDKVIGGFADTRVVDNRVDILGDVAHVYVRFWCRIYRVDGDPLDGQVRQTFVLRNTDERWLVRHYHESRQIPGFPVIDIGE